MSHLHELAEAMRQGEASERRRGDWAATRADIDLMFGLLQPMNERERTAIIKAYTAGFKRGAAMAGRGINDSESL